MAAHPQFITPEQYLERERKAEIKSEYLHGEVFAMSGGNYRHALLITDCARELGNHLQGTDCRVVTRDMRVRVSEGGLYTYPDIIVVCGLPAFLDSSEDTLLNPRLIVEVLSNSTRNYDLGGKFEAYRQLNSLEEYVTIEQKEVRIVTRKRQDGDSWLMHDHTDLQGQLSLVSLDVSLSMAGIYRGF